jgi:peptide/nickel transport system substrate-binding protein
MVSYDADDVVASFNHHRSPDSKSAAKAILSAVSGIRTDGKETLVFALTEPRLCGGR